MKRWSVVVATVMKAFALMVVGGLLSSCLTEREGQKLANQMFMLDLTIPSMVYYGENAHWPKDYAELSRIAQQLGYQTGQYDRVDLTEVPGGALHIYAVAGCCFTNQTTLQPPQDTQKR